jgi:hypothetical protein
LQGVQGVGATGLEPVTSSLSSPNAEDDEDPEIGRDKP